MKLLPNFIAATSGNLPFVDYAMIMVFFTSSIHTFNSCTTGSKISKSSLDAYGDQAVGWVQLQRMTCNSGRDAGELCTIRCGMRPQHKQSQKDYSVVVKIKSYRAKDRDDAISYARCESCPASQGFCKHGGAMLFWLNRRTNEASPTEITCYWRKAPLAKAMQEGVLKATDITKKSWKDPPRAEPLPNPGDFRCRVLAELMSVNSPSPLVHVFSRPIGIESISVHHLIFDFLVGGGGTVDMFLAYCSNRMTEALCCLAEEQTRDQFLLSTWSLLRFARITASKLHELAQCEKFDGVLVEHILGARFKPTAAMERGIKLERLVLDVAEERLQVKIRKCGLFLHKDYPVFGASPDGIFDGTIVEVKSPIGIKTMKNYISERGNIRPKVLAQIQLQMHICGVPKGILCIAAPDFETTRNINIIHVRYDVNYTKIVMGKALNKWKKAIYPRLQRSADLFK